MKKTFKYLILFVVLLLVGVRVEAKDAYTQKWSTYWEPTWVDGGATFWDVAEIYDNNEDLKMMLVTGEIENGEDGGVLAKYYEHANYNLALTWRLTEGRNGKYLKTVKLSDGAVYLSYDSHNIDGQIKLVKKDFDYNDAWSSVVVENENISYSNVPYMTMSTSNGLIGFTFNSSIYLYDLDGKLVKKFDTSLIRPGITLNENGIYIVGRDSAANLVLSKYAYDTFEEVVSVNVYEGSLANMLDIQSDSKNIVVAANDYVEGNEIVVFDKDLKELSRVKTDIDVVEIEIEKDGFYVIGKYHGTNGPNVTYKSALRKYNYDLESEWEIIQNEFTPYGLTIIDNDVIVVGDKNQYFGYIARYTPPTYDILVSNDGNGEVTASFENAVAGVEVGITVTPLDGYQLKNVVVTDGDGKNVEVINNKFIMPEKNVEIYVEFELIPEEPIEPVLPDNPITGLNNPLFILGGILSIALVGTLLIKKKKYI